MVALRLDVAGQPRFASIFTDNMVLQQSTKANIWGYATKADVVTVAASWSSKPVTAIADATGRWSVVLQTPKASYTSQTLTVTGGNGQSATLANVLVGEVWLCSGQSNMEMILKSQPEWNLVVEGSAEAIANANNPYLRYLPIDRKESFTPQREALTKGWKVCTPGNAEWFSAAAYFFGEKLQKQLQVPVGLVVSSYGGSPIQAWMPESVGADNARYQAEWKDRTEEFEASKQSPEQYKAKMNEWIAKADANGRATINAETKKVKVPEGLTNTPEGNQMGGILYTKDITISSDLRSKDLDISLGSINDLGRVYFNGELVWEEIRNSHSYANATFTVPANKVKHDGANRIEVYLLNVLWNGGLTGPDYNMYYCAKGEDKRITLATEWDYKVIFDFWKSDKMPREGKPLFSNFAALYNGMIHPLIGYNVKGLLWYQGEGNVDQDDRYAAMMHDMVGAWRKDWNQQLPFYFVQIAPYKYGGDTDSRSTLIREAQSKFAKEDKLSEMVSTIDLGDPSNIHPARKREVGERLANIALGKTYKKGVAYKFPEVAKATAHDAVVTLKLKNTYSGIKLQGDNHEFELSRDGKTFVKANVKPEGNSLMLSSDSCDNPRYVRYCWRDASTGTVFNSEGLPLSSFRIEVK